jgi:hypothetical protein
VAEDRLQHDDLEGWSACSSEGSRRLLMLESIMIGAVFGVLAGVIAAKLLRIVG